jgi:zinc ribbon protein
MHCPSCGQPATIDQQFCRSCGMSLKVVGDLVAAHSNLPISDNESRINKAEAERQIAHRMFKWLGWGLVILGIGIVMLVANRNFTLPGWFRLVAFFFILFGMVVSGFSVFRGIREGIDVSGVTSKRVSGGRDIKSLPTERIPVLMESVTERTTELISREKLTTQPEKNDHQS